jgi:hypothetical protein
MATSTDPGGDLTPFLSRGNLAWDGRGGRDELGRGSSLRDGLVVDERAGFSVFARG